MISAGLFTQRDLAVITKAAVVAERLTQEFFDLADEWKRDPYFLFTRKQVGKSLYEADVFASVVKVTPPAGGRVSRPGDHYGIVLQDPNILLALLRSRGCDLWTLSLFVLTHELVHIVRFRKNNVDFLAATEDRDKEEDVVHEITREILAGAGNTDYILSLYELPAIGARSSTIRHITGGNSNADLRIPM
jgi:hypothetical protein